MEWSQEYTAYLDRPECSPLPHDKFVELAVRARAGDRDARERMVLSNLRLAAKEAYRHAFNAVQKMKGG